MKKYMYFCIITVLIAGIAKAVPVQWSIDNGGNDHLYEAVLVVGGISWTDARDDAISKGGHLVTISSSSENDFVFDIISSDIFWTRNAEQTSAWHGPWLGGYRSGENWTWITGEMWIYDNWLNTGYLGDGSYVHFYAFDNPSNTWDDENDQHPWLPVISYVVEYEIPEPATLLLLGLGGLILRRRKS